MTYIVECIGGPNDGKFMAFTSMPNLTYEYVSDFRFTFFNVEDYDNSQSKTKHIYELEARRTGKDRYMYVYMYKGVRY